MMGRRRKKTKQKPAHTRLYQPAPATAASTAHLTPASHCPATNPTARSSPERVDVVDALVRRDAAEQRRRPPRLQGVPADVRHRQSGSPVELGHAAGDDAEALEAARLVGALEEQLQAEADAEEGLALLLVFCVVFCLLLDRFML